MEIRLQRINTSQEGTPGDLTIDDDTFSCVTLEDPVRERKIDGDSAIPAGRYRVIVNYSQRFHRLMPLLLGVPGFAGVRIHKGSTKLDTLGCILVGSKRDGYTIHDCQEPYDYLLKHLIAESTKERESWITITNGWQGQRLG
jgi:hypothetical protein